MPFGIFYICETCQDLGPICRKCTWTCHRDHTMTVQRLGSGLHRCACELNVSLSGLILEEEEDEIEEKNPREE